MATLGQQGPFRNGEADTGASSPIAYVAIRDEIIGNIIGGVYPPGVRLPSNSQIQERWQVSHATSRRVLQELEKAGWARSEGRRGYFATTGPANEYHRYGGTLDARTDGPDWDEETRRDPGTAPHGQPHAVPQPTAHGHPATYPQAPPAPPQPAPPRPIFTVEVGGRLPDRFTSVAYVHAQFEPIPPEAAAALRVTSGGMVVNVRRRIITDPGGSVPLELRTSYTPGIKPDSPLASPDVIAQPWPQALSAHTPHAPATASSTISARHPSDYEAAALKLPTHAIVIVRATTLQTVTGATIDFTTCVWPAESTTLSVPVHTPP